MDIENLKNDLLKQVEDTAIKAAKDALDGSTEKFKLSLEDEIKKMDKGLNEEQINDLIGKSESGVKDLFKEMNERLDQSEVNMKKGQGNEKPLSFNDQIRKSLEDNKANLVKMTGSAIEAKKNAFEFEIKAVGDMSIAGNISGGNVPVEDRIAGFNALPQRAVKLLDLMNKRRTSSLKVSWVYQTSEDGTAAQTTEGNAKNQIDFDLVVDSEDIVKTTAYIRATTEMIGDTDWMLGAITGNLSDRLFQAVELGAYSGAGTTNTLHGIRTTASAFAAGTFANAVDNANDVDVLEVAFNQIKIANKTIERGAIFMHPSDVTALKMVKVLASSTDNRYVTRLSQIGSTLMLDGTYPIIESTLITQGEYLVGDMSKANLYEKDGIRVEVGLDGNDFTENFRTILIEWRGAVVVETNDRTSFVKGNFATNKASLETT
tara:strand:+ start:10206 stop:11501 length:1296 start_codon:yes stop_codon:yes gene_type:complete